MKRGYLKANAKNVLIIGIIVALVLVVIYFVKSRYQGEELETIKTNMLLIEAQTKQIAEKVNMKEKGASYVGIKIEEFLEDEQIKKLQELNMINIDEKKTNYYVLQQEHLEQLGLSEIKLEQGYYIVEYNTNEIIYSNGIQDNLGKTLYKLTDIQNII